MLCHFFLSDGEVDIFIDIFLGTLSIQHFSGKILGVILTIVVAEFAKKRQNFCSAVGSGFFIKISVVDELVDDLMDFIDVGIGFGDQGQV